MKNRFRFLILLWIVLLVSPAQAQDAVSDLLGRINGLRGQLGLSPYTINGALAAAAQNQASWMVTTGQVSHIQNDGSTPRSRAQANGYTSPWVSENIYMGSLAGVGDAWNFWINSAIHYAGLTSPNYREIGIGTARGASGQAFVLVFGNPDGTIPQAPRSSGSNNGESAPSQPSYVVGLDEFGNIKHEVQPGDTLGDILLIYGYTWDDLPDILTLNEMSDADIRSLDIGQVLLIPPQSGTYTPAPPEATAEATEPAQAAALAVTDAGQTAAPTAAETVLPAATTDPSIAQVILPTPLPITETEPATLTPTPSPTQGLVISTLPAATAVAAVINTPSPLVSPPSAAETPVSSGPPLWLIAAIALQVVVLLYASVEFIRRMKKR